MRLIDKDELLKRAMFHEDCFGNISNWKYVVSYVIEQFPEEDPTIHAKWVEESGTIVCSHCKHKRNTADREYTMYCGHCGAKMGEDK